MPIITRQNALPLLTAIYNTYHIIATMGEDGPAGISRKTAIVIEDTEHTYRCFPFLKLPPEIRNRIYELVFVSPNYIGTNGTQTKSFYKDASRWRNLAFAKSCRQIYSESANIFYARNGFEFHYIRPFLEFMEAIGPSRRKLVSKIRYYFLSGRPFIALRYLRSCANLEELEISVKIITKGKKNSWWSYPLKDAKAFLFSKAKIIDFGPIRTFGKAGEVAEENSHIIDLQKRLLASDLAKVRAEMVGIYRR